jgi:N-acetylmuramoyl-L-alanine amidase
VTRILRLIALLAWGLAGLSAAQAPPTSARELYAAALAREQALRADHAPTLAQYRSATNAYDIIVRRYPASGYADNALWQGGSLSLEAFERFGEARDEATARRLFFLLGDQYPFSPLSPKARDAVKRIDARNAAAGPSPGPAPASAQPPAASPAPAPTTAPAARRLAQVKDVRRTIAGSRVRVTVELDGPAPYRSEAVDSPRRMFVDIGDTRLGPGLAEGTMSYDEDVVRKVRIGRHPNDTTRVVVDLSGIRRYTVSTEAAPFRIVIDCEPDAAPDTSVAAPAPRAAPSRPAPAPVRPALPSHPVSRGWSEGVAVNSVDVWALLDHSVPPPTVKPVAPPSPLPGEVGTSEAPPKAGPSTPIPPRGSYSISRQLGLGASKIVIDPGHGGHDPGALGPGISEAEVVLDVAIRLEALLLAAGFEVVLTRRADEYVALEERPAIATREQADLFVSIHANASRDRSARGIETYILHFANDPDAAAVAVRENAATERRMNSLPDIVKAITLNNKFDESRSFAGLIQRAMAQQLRGDVGLVVDHGVKQAPFVVLIGAAMPSILVEISFITNVQEGRLLKTPAFRQRIAQGLFDGIRGYQKSLKFAPTELSR